jgi:hypothetical protein
MKWVALAIVVGIVIWVVFQTNKRQEEKRIHRSKEWERERLSDENVLKEQSEFEHRLDENAGLPDGIVWQRAYTYRHLMRRWFAALIAQHRYDNVMSEKLKTDWLNYLDLLEHQATASFLSAEATDEEKEESYGKESWQMRQQYMAIEDGFAAAIGKEATAELERVRAAAHRSFDRSGIKPMAPEGFYYSPISLNPYDEELKRETRPTPNA